MEGTQIHALNSQSASRPSVEINSLDGGKVLNDAGRESGTWRRAEGRRPMTRSREQRAGGEGGGRGLESSPTV